jgi:transposase
VVYHYSAKRDRRDNHTLDKQVERAQKIADGTKPLKKDRFVKLRHPPRRRSGPRRPGPSTGWAEGYVTNIPQVRLTGNEIVAAYHELFQVEASFRMAKTDLRARPMFHHEADSIHAHLTIVFTALAISRHLQDLTGASVRKIVRTLRPLRDVTISINGNEIVAKTPPGDTAQAILDAVAASVTH